MSKWMQCCGKIYSVSSIIVHVFGVVKGQDGTWTHTEREKKYMDNEIENEHENEIHMN